MKKVIILSCLLSLNCFGQIINTNTKQVYISIPKQINIGSTIIDNPTKETLYDLGFRPAVRVRIENKEVVSIPEEIQLAASKYKNILNGIFGENAHTNKEITEEYVALNLALDENSDPNVGIRLKALFDILNEYWGKGEVWTFPYDQAQYTTTNIISRWQAVEE